MLDDYALASDVGPQFGNVTVGSVSESSNRKITQLVRLAALECAKTTNLRAVPARALPDLYLGIVSGRLVRGTSSLDCHLAPARPGLSFTLCVSAVPNQAASAALVSRSRRALQHRVVQVPAR